MWRYLCPAVTLFILQSTSRCCDDCCVTKLLCAPYLPLTGGTDLSCRRRNTPTDVHWIWRAREDGKVTINCVHVCRGTCCHTELPRVLCASDIPSDFLLVINLVTLKFQQMAFSQRNWHIITSTGVRLIIGRPHYPGHKAFWFHIKVRGSSSFYKKNEIHLTNPTAVFTISLQSQTFTLWHHSRLRRSLVISRRYEGITNIWIKISFDSDIQLDPQKSAVVKSCNKWNSWGFILWEPCMSEQVSLATEPKVAEIFLSFPAVDWQANIDSGTQETDGDNQNHKRGFVIQRLFFCLPGS